MKTNTPSSLRIGVLGCANIARQFTRDVQGSTSVSIDAVASRDTEKAQAFARDFQIAKAYGSYEALIADPAIDAIYIPMPNSLHAEWAIRAMQGGKHVLCEKPLALDLAQARAMFETAHRHGVMLLESYPYWFQPQTRDLVSLLRSPAPHGIGEVRSMQASFGFTLGNPTHNIRMKPELGGGALLDAGSYPLSLTRLVMGCAPQSVMAHANWADSGVDIRMVATLVYADGRHAQISCAMDTATHRQATVMGTHGTIETEYLNHTSTGTGHPWGYLPSQMRVRKGTANNVAFEEIPSATGSGFRFAAEAFAQVIRDNDVQAIEQTTAASLDIAATLEAIAQSARTGQPVTVEKQM